MLQLKQNSDIKGGLKKKILYQSDAVICIIEPSAQEKNTWQKNH